METDVISGDGGAEGLDKCAEGLEGDVISRGEGAEGLEGDVISGGGGAEGLDGAGISGMDKQSYNSINRYLRRPCIYYVF